MAEGSVDMMNAILVVFNGHTVQRPSSGAGGAFVPGQAHYEVSRLFYF